MQKVKEFKDSLQRKTGSPGWSCKEDAFTFTFTLNSATQLWGWNAYVRLYLNANQENFYSLYLSETLQTQGFPTRRAAVEYLKAVYLQTTGTQLQINKMTAVEGIRYVHAQENIHFVKRPMEDWLVEKRLHKNSSYGVEFICTNSLGQKIWHPAVSKEDFPTLDAAILAYFSLKEKTNG